MAATTKAGRFPDLGGRVPGLCGAGTAAAATGRPVPRSRLLAGRRAGGVPGRWRRRRRQAGSPVPPVGRRASRGPGRGHDGAGRGPPGPRRAPLRPRTPSDLGEYTPSRRRGERERADRRPMAASRRGVVQTRTGFGATVSVSPLFVRASGGSGRHRRGGVPARAGPRADAGPPPVTRSDRERRKRVLSAGRRGAGYRIPFWSARHRTPARPAGPLRARARPAPPPIRTDGTPGGPDPPETALEGPGLHREW